MPIFIYPLWKITFTLVIFIYPPWKITFRLVTSRTMYRNTLIYYNYKPVQLLKTPNFIIKHFILKRRFVDSGLLVRAIILSWSPCCTRQGPMYTLAFAPWNLRTKAMFSIESEAEQEFTFLSCSPKLTSGFVVKYFRIHYSFDLISAYLELSYFVSTGEWFIHPLQIWRFYYCEVKGK